MKDTPYLIKAETREKAEVIAQELKLADNDWFHLPFTNDDDHEAVYTLGNTKPVTYEAIRYLADEEMSELRLDSQRNVRLLLAAKFWEAAAYASERNWWLYSWVWIEIPVLTQVKEYQLLTD